MYTQQMSTLNKAIMIAHRDRKVSKRFATFFWGGAGIGKTEILAQDATDCDMALIDVRVGQREPGDLIGIPRILKKFRSNFLQNLFDKAEQKRGFGMLMVLLKGLLGLFFSTDSYMTYALPNYLPHYLKDEKGNIITKNGRKCLDIEGMGDIVRNKKQLLEKFGGDLTNVKGVVILLDEFNRIAGDDMKQALFQLPEQYKMNTYEVPDGCCIFALANPNTDDYQVAELDSDKAMMDRFLHIKVRPRVEDWMVWAQKDGLMPEIISFANSVPGALFEDEKPYELPISRTPRSMKLLDILLKEVDLPKDDSILSEVVMGTIGKHYGPIFIKHLKENLNKIPSGEDIFTRYKKVQSLMQEAMKAKKIDFINQTNRNIYAYCSDAENWPVIEENLDQFDLYLKDLKSEIRMALVQQLIKIKVSGQPLGDILGQSDEVYFTLKADSDKAEDLA